MIKINNLSLIIKNKTILDNINITIKDNSLTTIIGPNGSGKTSLIKCLYNIYKYKGEIIVDDINLNNYNITDLSKKIAILNQEKELLNITVYELFTYARFNKIGLFSKLSKKDEKYIDKIATLTNTFSYYNTQVAILSGGIRQMVYLACAIIQDSKYLILDEPTNNLDAKNHKLLYEIISYLKSINKTIILITHDLSKAFEISDEVILLNDSKLITTYNKDNRNLEKVEEAFYVKSYQIEDTIFFK